MQTTLKALLHTERDAEGPPSVGEGGTKYYNGAKEQVELCPKAKGHQYGSPEFRQCARGS
jgi:hypothetical protein